MRLVVRRVSIPSSATDLLCNVLLLPSQPKCLAPSDKYKNLQVLEENVMITSASKTGSDTNQDNMGTYPVKYRAQADKSVT